jgi:site-specific DNA recombinase
MQLMAHAKPTKVIGYCRVSTARQADEGVSLEAQTSKLRMYCDLYGLELVGVVVDSGVSAKTLKRPGLASALARMEAGEASGLLVAKLDRLTRSVKDLGILVETYFGDGQHELLSVADNIDTRSAGGRLVLNVLASVSQWEREAIGERTKDALGYLRAEGVQLGGAALGWRRGDTRDESGRRVVERVEAEAATVARIMELRADGFTLRASAAALEAEGRRTKTGGRWFANTIRRVVARAERPASCHPVPADCAA